jgi:hypothetical protein
MSGAHVAEERPCLHCMMVELIDDSSPNILQAPRRTKSIPAKQTK